MIRFESSVPGPQTGLNGRLMKSNGETESSGELDTLRAEYDFSAGVRGKHAAKYAEGTNVVVLDPDVARDFPTAEVVNETLRAVSKMLCQQ